MVRFLVLLLALTCTQSAAAQSIGTCEGVESPAVLVQLGASLAQNGAWDSAAICFERLRERATDDVMRGDAAFNLGIAYQSLGRHREARDVFAEWLGAHAAASDDATRSQVAQLFAQESGRVGGVVLSLPTPTPEGTEVRVNGRVADVRSSTTVEVDPGTQAITVSAPGHTTFTWDGRVDDGARVAVDVVLIPIAPPPENIVESPVFWVGMVLLAGAIAGGVIAGVFLQDEAQVDAPAGFEVLRL